MIRIVESDQELADQRKQYLDLLLKASRAEASRAEDENVGAASAAVVVGVTGPAAVGTTKNAANVVVTGPTGPTGPTP